MAAWDILLDLDDTCIPNAHKYSDAIWRCGAIIGRAMGVHSPHPQRVIELHAEIDIGMVKEHGLQLDRFPRSWVETYVRLCGQAGIQPKASVKRLLANTASRFKFGPFRPFPGTKSALAALRKDGHRLHMITSGVDSLQNRKIDQAGLRKYFDSIHITSLKKKAIMAQLVGESPQTAVMVGDSKKSDIRPAKELGIVTVWIPSDTWSFANDPVDPDHQILQIGELPALVRKIVRGR